MVALVFAVMLIGLLALIARLPANHPYLRTSLAWSSLVAGFNMYMWLNVADGGGDGYFTPEAAGAVVTILTIPIWLGGNLLLLLLWAASKIVSPRFGREQAPRNRDRPTVYRGRA